MFNTKLIKFIYLLPHEQAPFPVNFVHLNRFFSLCYFLKNFVSSFESLKHLFLDVANFNYIFLQFSRLIFSCILKFKKKYLNIRRKWLIISKFSLLFCGRSISESNNFCNLDQRDFVWLQEQKRCIGISFSKLQKELRGEETILNSKSFSFKYKTLLKCFYWNIPKLVSIFTSKLISLFGKSFSKYISNLVLVSFRERERERERERQRERQRERETERERQYNSL